jgi:hypothetical protein
VALNANACKILVRKREEKELHGTVGEGGGIITKWILKKQDSGMRTGFMWLRIQTNGKFL